MTINVKELTDEEILNIINTCKCEFYHKDGYGVDVRWYFTPANKYHHTEFLCKRDEEEWFGDPLDIVGNISHIDEIFDEMCERGLGLEE